MATHCNKHKQHKQGGFTLVELLLVIALASIISVFAVQSKIAQIRIDEIKHKINITTKEVEHIHSAAGGYIVDTDSWPDFTNNCADAITTLTTSTPAYLLYIGNQSQYYTNYITSCDTNTFSVQITTDTNDNALRLSSDIPDSTATVNIVTASIPRPEEQPTLQQFLMLDGSRAMTGDLDMGGNAITNTSNVEATDGRTLVNVETIAPLPTATVSKPTCPAGLTPRINLATTGIVLSSSKVPFANPPFIESQTATQWTVRLNVFDEDGAATATTGTFVQAISSCNK